MSVNRALLSSLGLSEPLSDDAQALLKEFIDALVEDNQLPGVLEFLQAKGPVWMYEAIMKNAPHDGPALVLADELRQKRPEAEKLLAGLLGMA